MPLKSPAREIAHRPFSHSQFSNPTRGRSSREPRPRPRNLLHVFDCAAREILLTTCDPAAAIQLATLDPVNRIVKPVPLADISIAINAYSLFARKGGAR